MKRDTKPYNSAMVYSHINSRLPLFFYNKKDDKVWRVALAHLMKYTHTL